MSGKLDLTGERFGRLTVLREDGRLYKAGFIAWLCRCDCGTEKRVSAQALRKGATVSCGCHRRQKLLAVHTVHGAAAAHTPEYEIWKAMRQRCMNPNNRAFKHYGGRGIRVCDRWLNGEGSRSGFECFLADMGHRPSADLSIDRIDNDGNYEPGNCRWTTQSEQVRNRRKVA